LFPIPQLQFQPPAILSLRISSQTTSPLVEISNRISQFAFIVGSQVLNSDTLFPFRREWNIAATDDSLWRTQFLYLFGSPNFSVNDVTVAGRQEGIHESDQDYWKEQVLRKPLDNTVWLKAFNLAAKGMVEIKKIYLIVKASLD